MNRDASITPENITIDEMENTPSLDHATLFKIRKDPLDNGIKSALEAQLVTLQKMFTQRMERILN